MLTWYLCAVMISVNVCWTGGANYGLLHQHVKDEHITTCLVNAPPPLLRSQMEEILTAWNEAGRSRLLCQVASPSL